MTFGGCRSRDGLRGGSGNFCRKKLFSLQINTVELLDTQPLARPPQLPHQPAKPRAQQVSRPTIIRGFTYYKAQVPDEEEDENDIEELREWGGTWAQ